MVQERPGELFLHHFWLITSWSVERMNAEALLEHYRQWGTAGGYLGAVLAQSVLHVARLLLEEAIRKGWSLKRLWERVLRVAARVRLAPPRGGGQGGGDHRCLPRLRRRLPYPPRQGGGASPGHG